MAKVKRFMVNNPNGDAAAYAPPASRVGWDLIEKPSDIINDIVQKRLKEAGYVVPAVTAGALITFIMALTKAIRFLVVNKVSSVGTATAVNVAAKVAVGWGLFKAHSTTNTIIKGTLLYTILQDVVNAIAPNSKAAAYIGRFYGLEGAGIGRLDTAYQIPAAQDQARLQAERARQGVGRLALGGTVGDMRELTPEEAGGAPFGSGENWFAKTGTEQSQDWYETGSPGPGNPSPSNVSGRSMVGDVRRVSQEDIYGSYPSKGLSDPGYAGTGFYMGEEQADPGVYDISGVDAPMVSGIGSTSFLDSIGRLATGM